METRSAQREQCQSPNKLDKSEYAHKAWEATRRRCHDEENSDYEPQGERHWKPGENAPTSEEIGQVAWSSNAE